MSYSTWSERGYGFEIFNGLNLDAVKNYLINNCQKFMNSYDYDTKEWHSFDERTRRKIAEAKDEYELAEAVGVPGCSYCIAEYLNEKYNTNIFAGYAPSDIAETADYIGVAPLYPWQIKGSITKEQAEEILETLATELEMEGKEIDDFDIEYGG